jgi:ABC-type uncharacterized transport system ATPase subunit
MSSPGRDTSAIRPRLINQTRSHDPPVETLRRNQVVRQRPCVDGLDLTITRGEIVAVLGPNGAGKSTTTELIPGLIRPDAGEVRVFGMEPTAASVWPGGRDVAGRGPAAQGNGRRGAG